MGHLDQHATLPHSNSRSNRLGDRLLPRVSARLDEEVRNAKGNHIIDDRRTDFRTDDEVDSLDGFLLVAEREVGEAGLLGGLEGGVRGVGRGGVRASKISYLLRRTRIHTVHLLVVSDQPLDDLRGRLDRVHHIADDCPHPRLQHCEGKCECTRSVDENKDRQEKE